MTPPSKLNRLAERVEAATADAVSHLLQEALVTVKPDGHIEECGRYIAAGAYLDAAMTLVPEGWNWMAGYRNYPKARAYVNNGELAFEGIGTRPNPRQQWFEVVAATPALALTAACLRAAASKARADGGENG